MLPLISRAAVCIISLMLPISSFAFKSQPRTVVHPLVIGAVPTGIPLATPKLFSSGSSVVISPGYAITSAHVVTNNVPDHPSVEMILNMDFNGKPIPITVVDIDSKHDLALITGKFTCPCASLYLSQPPIDSPVFTVGFPLYGLYKTQILSEGRLQGSIGDNYITTAQAAPGSSGGGIFIRSASGRIALISIVEGIAASKGDANTIQVHSWLVLSVPVKSIKPFLEKNNVPYNVVF